MIVVAQGGHGANRNGLLAGTQMNGPGNRRVLLRAQPKARFLEGADGGNPMECIQQECIVRLSFYLDIVALHLSAPLFTQTVRQPGRRVNMRISCKMVMRTLA